MMLHKAVLEYISSGRSSWEVGIAMQGKKDGEESWVDISGEVLGWTLKSTEDHTAGLKSF